MNDLFADVFKGQKPSTVEASLSRITEILNIIRMCRQKSIYDKITEEHVEKSSYTAFWNEIIMNLR